MLAGCAPKIITPSPPQYIEELSLEEIIKKVSGDIEALKSISEVLIEKNGEPYDQATVSVLLKKPDLAHVRIYKFGMLVKDIVMKDGKLYFLVGKNDKKLGAMTDEFFHTIFWWDGLNGGSMSVEEDEYVIKTEKKEIHLDRATRLPLQQDIHLLDKVIHITYSEPHDYEGLLYPSRLEIAVDNLKLIMKIEKLLVNPPLGETDFRVPSES